MTLQEFQNIDLRVGKIMNAERIPGSEKLIKLDVDLGEAGLPALPAGRQIVAGIGKAYAPETLIGREIAIVANLEPRKLMGEESNGMLLAASDENGEPVLLTLEREVPPGAKIK